MAGNSCTVDALGFIVIDEAITLDYLEKLKESPTDSPRKKTLDLAICESSKKEYLFHRMEGASPVIKKRTVLPQSEATIVSRKGL